MIEIAGLTKRYDDLVALKPLNLTIPRGEVFGLIGPNGAGKTTTLSILATLLEPTAGRVWIDGHDLRRAPDRIRRVIGYMPDFAGVYEDMQVDEYLYFFAATAGIHGAEATRMVGDVLELTDLTSKRTALVETLSRGMRQRLGVARVLLHDPKVLLLDEPASGLDPRARIEMRHLLLELRRMEKTVIISSHILAELYELCTSVGILERGRMLYSGSVTELLRRMRRAHIAVVKVADPAAAVEADPEAAMARAREVLLQDPRITDAHPLDDRLEVHARESETDLSFIPALLIGAGLGLHFFSEEPLTLEDAFMRLTKGGIGPVPEEAESQTDPEAISDATPDVRPDVRPDLRPDLRPDETPDAIPDAAPDATPDAAPAGGAPVDAPAAPTLEAADPTTTPAETTPGDMPGNATENAPGSAPGNAPGTTSGDALKGAADHPPPPHASA